MNAAVMSLYTEEYNELAAITIEGNKKLYCEKHGYDLILRTNRDEFTYQHTGFEKLLFVKQTLESGKYDWVYWCGTDTLITNFNIKLEDLVDNGYHFIVSVDIWDINADSFLCRNSPQAINFLESLLMLHDSYVDENNNGIDTGRILPDGNPTCWAEQQAIIDLAPSYKNIVKLEPQKKLNSYLYNIYNSPWHQKGLDCWGNNGTWAPGDFLLHLPGMPNSQRIKICETIKPQIIGV